MRIIETCFATLYEKTAECLKKDRDPLLAFYDFPAEHWKHLRTSNPIESTFATVRHRTIRSKGCLSNRTALAMVFKLVEGAQKTWRRRRPLPEALWKGSNRPFAAVPDRPCKRAERARKRSSKRPHPRKSRSDAIDGVREDNDSCWLPRAAAVGRGRWNEGALLGRMLGVQAVGVALRLAEAAGDGGLGVRREMLKAASQTRGALSVPLEHERTVERGRQGPALRISALR